METISGKSIELIVDVFTISVNDFPIFDFINTFSSNSLTNYCTVYSLPTSIIIHRLAALTEPMALRLVPWRVYVFTSSSLHAAAHDFCMHAAQTCF